MCNICSNNNKGKTYNNQFYICGTCNKNMCPLCKDNHNKEYKIIDYDNKNYLCNKHNEQYILSDLSLYFRIVLNFFQKFLVYSTLF